MKKYRQNDEKGDRIFVQKGLRYIILNKLLSNYEQYVIFTKKTLCYKIISAEYRNFNKIILKGRLQNECFFIKI